MKTKTFAVARVEILNYLASQGWDLSKRDLKIPHATSPDGRLRLWFKPQAVHFTTSYDGRGQAHVFGNARAIAYDLDIRTATPAEVIECASLRVPA